MQALADERRSGRWPAPAAFLLTSAACLAAALALSPAASAVDPPVAVISLPITNSTFDANSTIVFSANGSTDPDLAGPLYFIWDFPSDRVEGFAEQVVYYSNFSTPGSYTVQLTVRDNESLEDRDNVTVIIRPANQPPTAVIAWPANASRFFSDEFVNLSAQGSWDPEGGPLAYFWSTNLSGQFGTGENLSVRLVAGRHTITLRVVDNRGGEDTASVDLAVEVNVPPHIALDPVTPPSGFAGDLFAFVATYTEDNGERAAGVMLVLNGTPHAMALSGGLDPRAGQRYSIVLPVGAGRHSYYVLADDGNLTNLTLALDGPEVWMNVSVLSSDARASLATAVVPPLNVTVALWGGALAPDPAGLVPVSPAYFVNASALALSNFTLEVAFAPDARVNASSARLHRLSGSSWLGLVTALDGSSHVGRAGGTPAELPAVFRIFAGQSARPANQAPLLEITYRGDFFPNSTVAFDSGNSSDPEGATLLLAWNFSGPGLATGWLPGRVVSLAFPAAGMYNISLRGDDGSGNVRFLNITLEVRERPVAPVGSLEETVAFAVLAAAVAAAGGLSVWWRRRGPPRKKAYEDLYGRLYKDKMTEEKEYSQLFRKFAAVEEAPTFEEDAGGQAPPPGRDPPA